MKYSTIFSSVIKPLVSEEKDKYLAMASLVDVGDFVPDIDTENNIDLLPIAFNSCVVNRVNKNGDVIDTETALAIYENFTNKPINIEHNRDRVVGVILNANFSEFGTDKPLSKEEVEGTTAPFNITLGGVVWKVVSPSLADIIEDSNDPTSENYEKVSASWELGFSDYDLIILGGDEKNIENGEIISDTNKIEELQDSLKSMGGTGKLEDGKKVYRRVYAGVVPLGIGLTETPAADVVGVAVKKCEEQDKLLAEEGEATTDNLEKTSHSNDNNVNKTKEVVMKIESLKDINDESLKTLEASAVHEFIQDEIRRASEQFTAEKQEREEALEQAKEQNETLSKEQETLKEELTKVSESLSVLESEKKDREAQEQFNERMASFDEVYELTDDDRKVISSDIKDLDDETFSAYQEKMQVLLKDKSKKNLAEAEEAISEEETKEAKASEEETEEKEEVVDEALDNAEVESNTVANTTDAEEATVYEKYKNAFSIEQFDIKN
tara:strand:+ start:5157 stop:6644 length:1488 start_codon:yes stop_codon:yes gene_type:complete